MGHLMNASLSAPLEQLVSVLREAQVHDRCDGQAHTDKLLVVEPVLEPANPVNVHTAVRADGKPTSFAQHVDLDLGVVGDNADVAFCWSLGVLACTAQIGDHEAAAPGRRAAPPAGAPRE